MKQFSHIRIDCSSVTEFSAAYGTAFRSLPMEAAKRLGEIQKRYFGCYGIDGMYERMNHRTIAEIFAQYRQVDIRPIAAGERDGVTYELYKPGEEEDSSSM